MVQLAEVVVLERELEERVAEPATHADVLDRLEEAARAGDPRELRSQARDDVVGAELPFRERLQRDEQPSRVARSLVAAGESRDRVHGRVLHQDSHELRELVLHRLERRRLIGLQRAHQAAVVLLREEPLGHDREQIHVDRHRERRDEHREARVAEHP